MAIQTQVYERVLNMAQMHQIGVLHRGPDMLWTCRWNEAGRVSSIHAEEEIKQINLAYEVLKDPNLRLDYVRRLGRG
jgi:hypothetical protein